MTNCKRIILIVSVTLLIWMAGACGTTTLAATPTATPLAENVSQTAVFSLWTRPADGMVMVYVPEGVFTMGSDDPGFANENPAHTIFLDAFWIDQTEVTNKMYALCVAAGECDRQKVASSATRTNYYGSSEFANYPMDYVSWNDAKAYCTWAGGGFYTVHLPSEAEWEKTARGTDGRTYPWGKGNKCEDANFEGCLGDTAPVGSYESGISPYGAYDLIGNVWEWVGDWYSETYYSTLHNSVVDPGGPVSGTVRVSRGGAWSSSIDVSSASRQGYDPSFAGDDLGFRCSRSPASTLMPAQPPACQQPGTRLTDSVLFPETGELHKFSVYLPPCYAENTGFTYPVLYWTSAGGSGIFDTVDWLIHQGDTPPFIAISVDISPNKGFGADAQIVDDVVPYVDSHYRTQPDRQHRSITGFSHGAAIAIRTAFRAPDLFGRVAALSGGIADGEQEKISGWISAMAPDQRPAVLIDVGVQDGVSRLTYFLTGLLDKLNFPYTFIQDPGNHHTEYSDNQFPDYLKWLMPADQ